MEIRIGEDIVQRKGGNKTNLLIPRHLETFVLDQACSLQIGLARSCQVTGTTARCSHLLATARIKLIIHRQLKILTTLALDEDPGFVPLGYR